MGIRTNDLLKHIIRPTLRSMGEKYASPSAERLLLLTAGIESDYGSYLVQTHGPALGIYQIEPNSFHDLFINYLDYITLPFNCAEENFSKLIYDLKYSTKIARLMYYRHPEALPEYTDEEGLWKYYKKYWNSNLGATTEERFHEVWTNLVKVAV